MAVVVDVGLGDCWGRFWGVRLEEDCGCFVVDVSASVEHSWGAFVDDRVSAFYDLTPVL